MRAWASGESSPCSTRSFPIRPDSGPEEGGAREEGDRVEHEPDGDPRVAERPRALDHEQDPAYEGEHRRGRQNPQPDPLDVERESRDALRSGAERTQREELDHHPAADPDDRRRDVREEQERVPGHPFGPSTTR